MEKNVYRPGIFRLFSQTEFNRFWAVFFLECTEQSIPNDKHHPHVFIQVRNIGCMVHPVVRWRYKYPAIPFGQLHLVLGMHNIAVQLGYQVSV